MYFMQQLKQIPIFKNLNLFKTVPDIRNRYRWGFFERGKNIVVEEVRAWKKPTIFGDLLQLEVDHVFKWIQIIYIKHFQKQKYEKCMPVISGYNKHRKPTLQYSKLNSTKIFYFYKKFKPFQLSTSQ